MFIFLKPVLIFCASAISLAVLLDGSFLIAAQFRPLVGLWSTRSGWVLIFAIFWTIAFVIGLLIARSVHVFPFVGPLQR